MLVRFSPHEQKAGVTSGFKSATRRFTDQSKDDPGPGPYVPKSTLIQPVAVYSRPNRTEVLAPRPAEPPSIPARSQSHGYEVGPAGNVRPQAPAIPGYSGKRGDSVGPADYDPRVDVKFRGVSLATFPKAPERTALEKTLSKRVDAPGPGYYNTLSSFDLAASGPMDQDFLLHLNAAKRRQLSVFESKTARDSLQQEVSRKAGPGPGHYTLPGAIKVTSKPSSLQFFASCEPRFKDEVPRSMRLATAPGSYNVISSDFDQQKLQIMRHKKISQRSDWVQNVGFASTTGRFIEVDKNEIPPSTAYTPKVSIADHIAKPNLRSGPFGSKAERFKERAEREIMSKDQMKEMELNQDIAKYLAKNVPEVGPPSRMKQQFSSPFAPTVDNRLRPVKTPPGPAPGAYDLTPNWTTAKGVMPMVPRSAISRKTVFDTMPGPGTYNAGSSMGPKYKNRKNVMISTTTRELKMGGSSNPGPGDYDPAPLTGSMIKQSYNILLSDKY